MGEHASWVSLVRYPANVSWCNGSILTWGSEDETESQISHCQWVIISRLLKTLWNSVYLSITTEMKNHSPAFITHSSFNKYLLRVFLSIRHLEYRQEWDGYCLFWVHRKNQSHQMLRGKHLAQTLSDKYPLSGVCWVEGSFRSTHFSFTPVIWIPGDEFTFLLSCPRKNRLHRIKTPSSFS